MLLGLMPLVQTQALVWRRQEVHYCVNEICSTASCVSLLVERTQNWQKLPGLIALILSDFGRVNKVRKIKVRKKSENHVGGLMSRRKGEMLQKWVTYKHDSESQTVVIY